VEILTATHAFGALARMVTKKFGIIQVNGIVTTVLHLFGKGVKVVCEIACMIADAGLISTGEKAIIIGDAVNGEDTSVVLKPSARTGCWVYHLERFIHSMLY